MMDQVGCVKFSSVDVSVFTQPLVMPCPSRKELYGNLGNHALYTRRYLARTTPIAPTPSQNKVAQAST